MSGLVVTKISFFEHRRVFCFVIVLISQKSALNDTKSLLGRRQRNLFWKLKRQRLPKNLLLSLKKLSQNIIGKNILSSVRHVRMSCSGRKRIWSKFQGTIRDSTWLELSYCKLGYSWNQKERVLGWSIGH